MTGCEDSTALSKFWDELREMLEHGSFLALKGLARKLGLERSVHTTSVESIREDLDNLVIVKLTTWGRPLKAGQIIHRWGQDIQLVTQPKSDQGVQAQVAHTNKPGSRLPAHALAADVYMVESLKDEEQPAQDMVISIAQPRNSGSYGLNFVSKPLSSSIPNARGYPSTLSLTYVRTAQEDYRARQPQKIPPEQTPGQAGKHGSQANTAQLDMVLGLVENMMNMV